MQLASYRYTPASGWTTRPDPSLDSEQTLVVAFGPADATEVANGLADLQQAFPKALWMGCSTAGELFGRTVADGTLVVAVARFEHTRLQVAVKKIDDPQQSFAAGQELARTLADRDLKAIVVLSDGLTVNGSELVKGVANQSPGNVTITGGLAGDGSRFDHTWVFADRQPKAKCLAAVGLYGDRVHVAHGSRGGWDVLGPEREVTRAKGNILYAVDGQPALTLYKKYLGDRASGLPATGLLFPLAIQNDGEADGATVRTILAVDENANSITFAGDIPQGARVRLMRANFDRLVDGASDAARGMSLDDYRGGPLLSIAISCVGRRLVLGQRTEEEVDAVLDALPAGASLVGYYSYGEISPLASGRCDLHNQTMTLTAIWED